MDNDTPLLRRYVEHHDENAFSTLVHRRIGLVYSIALRRVGRDSHLAEDVTQKVFTDLARKAPALTGHTTLTGWLYVSAHHASAAAVRSEQRRKTRESATVAMQTPFHESIPEPDLNQLRHTLDEVIVALRDDERETIALRFFEKRSFAEIGAALKLSEDAARKRLDRALEKLRLALSRRGLTSTSLALTATLGELGASTVPPSLAAQITSGALASTAIAGTGWTLASVLNPTTLVGSAALLIGSIAVVQQEATNHRLATEVNRLSASVREIADLRAENARLVQAGNTITTTPVIQENRKEPIAAPIAPPITRPQIAPASTITVSEEGTLRWGLEPVTLDEFLTRLAALQKVNPGRETALVIQSHGNFTQTAYVIDEARKAGIQHVRVSESASVNTTFIPGWF